MTHQQRSTPLGQIQTGRQRRVHTLAQLQHRFAFRDTARFCAINQRATPCFFFFGQGIDKTLFQHPHIQLAQAGVHSDIAAAGLGDNLCCASRTT